MKQLVKVLVRKLARIAAQELANQPNWNDLLMLQGAQAALQLRSLDRLSCLSDAEFKVFSQWGEDGIIEWLVSRLPGIPQSFVEFGVEDYTEANTRFLLSHRNWRGVVLDGSAENVTRVLSRPNGWRNDLTAISAFITCENINELIGGAGFTGDIGLLSVDIDGNDYWVWSAITVVNPWVVIVEYNSILGDLKALSIPYNPEFVRLEAHHSGLYYGASAPAFEQLAARRGYVCLGSNKAGNNLFFIRRDVAHDTIAKIDDRRARTSLYAEARDTAGNLSMTYGVARREIINELPVTNLTTGITATLAQMGDLYSEYWIGMQQGKTLLSP